MLDPSNIEARYDLLQWYLETPGIAGGSTELALAQAEQIRKRDPYLGSIATGKVLEHENKFTNAEQAYQTAKALHADKPEAYYALGYLYLRRTNYDKALAQFEKILTLPQAEERPYQIGKKEAHYQIGKSCLLLGKGLDRAEENFKTYLQSKPNFFMPSLAWAHYRLGMVYERLGNRTKAHSEFQAALDLDSDHKEAKAALKNFK